MSSEDVMPYAQGERKCPGCQRWHSEEGHYCRDCEEEGELQMLMSKKRYSTRIRDGFRMLDGNS